MHQSSSLQLLLAKIALKPAPSFTLFSKVGPYEPDERLAAERFAANDEVIAETKAYFAGFGKTYLLKEDGKRLEKL